MNSKARDGRGGTQGHRRATALFCLIALMLAFAVQQPAQGQPKSAAKMPTAEEIVVLIRTTLLTLNDAIKTDNFTVMREAGSPDFAKVATVGKLTQSFRRLAEQKIDFSECAVKVPQMAGNPQIDDKGLLQLRGHFELSAARIDFALSFQRQNDRWFYRDVGVQALKPNAPAVQSQPSAKGLSNPESKPPARTNPESGAAPRAKSTSGNAREN